MTDRAFPNRPDHPDFWRLSEVVLQLDGAIDEAEDKEAVWERVVSDIVDIPSLEYMAEQRALRAVGSAAPVALITKLTALYLDGFCAGAKFAAEDRKEEQA